MATAKDRRAELLDSLAFRSAQLRFAKEVGSTATAPVRAVAGGSGGVAVLMVVVIFAGWVFASGRGKKVLEALGGVQQPEPDIKGPSADSVKGDLPQIPNAPVIPGRTPTFPDPRRQGGTPPIMPSGDDGEQLRCINCIIRHQVKDRVSWEEGKRRCIRSGHCEPLPRPGGAYVR